MHGAQLLLKMSTYLGFADALVQNTMGLGKAKLGFESISKIGFEQDFDLQPA